MALTAARGRGKSAALGLAVAGAVAFGYSFVFLYKHVSVLSFILCKYFAKRIPDPFLTATPISL